MTPSTMRSKHSQRRRRQSLQKRPLLIIGLIIVLGLVITVQQPKTARSLFRLLYHPVADSQQYSPAQTVLGARSTTSLNPGDVMTVTATAYNSTAEQTDGNPHQTASGTLPSPGTAAADFLPIGTRFIMGWQVYTVTDRIGGSPANPHVDLWFASETAAKTFGVQRVKIRILNLP